MNSYLPIPEGSQRWRWGALALALVVILIFARVSSFDFLEYDDRLYVVDNPMVVGGLTLAGLGYAFTTVDGGSWMPLTWLSHQLDSTFFGRTPGGRHWHNVLLHAATAVLLVLIFSLWRIPPGVAFTVGLWFAIHPMRNESVAWIAERKDVLSGFFFAVGLLVYHRYVRWPNATNYALLMLAAAFGLMAKPMLVTFPFVLLLLDFWPLHRAGSDWKELRRNVWALVREKIPLGLLAAGAAVATLLSQNNVGATAQWSAGMRGRLLDVLTNYWFYFHKTFWPVDLTVVYPPHHVRPGAAMFLAGCAAVGCGWLVMRAFRWPWLVVGCLWFIGMLIPVAGIVPVGMTMVADRYTYLPVIGLLLAVTFHLNWLARNRPAVRMGLYLLVGLGSGGLAVLTVRDLQRWQNTETLFLAAERVAPHPVAGNNLGSFYIRQQKFEQARTIAARAIELDPHFGPSYATRAMAHACLGDYAAAKRDYDEAIRLGDRPLRVSPGRAGLAIATDPEGDWAVFAAAVNLVPQTAADFLARGISHHRRGEIAAARADFTAAIRLDPGSAEAFYRRSGTGNLSGDTAEALADANRALELKPGWPDAFAARANVYFRMQDYERTLADQTRCLELAPANALYYQNRAVTYYQLRQFNAAWADLRRCQELGGRINPELVWQLTQQSGTNQFHQ